jgi:hypothetical protein
MEIRKRGFLPLCVRTTVCTTVHPGPVRRQQAPTVGIGRGWQEVAPSLFPEF